jgi:hypothetical protein
MLSVARDAATKGACTKAATTKGACTMAAAVKAPCTKATTGGAPVPNLRLKSAAVKTADMPGDKYRWVCLGEQPPSGGNELTNDKLAFALKRRSTLLTADMAAFGLDSNRLKSTDYINASGCYYRPAGPYASPVRSAAARCRWGMGVVTEVDERPTGGGDDEPNEGWWWW